jgi:hypothetical protein
MSTERKSATGENGEREAWALGEEDLAKIFNYPSIGQLFSESNTAPLDEFRSRLTSTRDELEKIVRHGNRAEADRAGTAINGVNVTLDFLQSLHEMRIAEKQ